MGGHTQAQPLRKQCHNTEFPRFELHRSHLNILTWGSRNSSVVKAGFFFRGPGFDSQHHMVAHNHM